MKKSFEVLNIRCNGCANSIKKALSEKFSNIEVDINSKKVTLDLEFSEDEEYIRNTLRKLGYPLKDEKLSTFQDLGLKAKSIASCSIGKFSEKEN